MHLSIFSVYNTGMATQDSAPKKRWPRWAKGFLKAFSRTGIVTDAAKAAKIDRDSVYNLARRSPDFRQAMEDAREQAADMLEKEAYRRAKTGLVRKKFTGKGEAVIDPGTNEQYVEREYSDTLLIFLLKGMRPEKFRDNYQADVKLDRVLEAWRSVLEAVRAHVQDQALVKVIVADVLRLLPAPSGKLALMDGSTGTESK